MVGAVSGIADDVAHLSMEALPALGDGPPSGSPEGRRRSHHAGAPPLHGPRRPGRSARWRSRDGGRGDGQYCGHADDHRHQDAHPEGLEHSGPSPPWRPPCHGRGPPGRQGHFARMVTRGDQGCRSWSQTPPGLSSAAMTAINSTARPLRRRCPRTGDAAQVLGRIPLVTREKRTSGASGRSRWPLAIAARSWPRRIPTSMRNPSPAAGPAS